MPLVIDFTSPKTTARNHNMNQPGSVAPKERINISYQQAGNDQEQVELPLKILVLGNYGGDPCTEFLEERKPVNINKDNFSSVMGKSNLRLSFEVADKIHDEADDSLPVSLSFTTLADFGPESIVAQCPELRKLMQLRQALTALKGPMGNIPQFRRRLRAIVGDRASRQALLGELRAPLALSSSQAQGDAQ